MTPVQRRKLLARIQSKPPYLWRLNEQQLLRYQYWQQSQSQWRGRVTGDNPGDNAALYRAVVEDDAPPDMPRDLREILYQE